MRQRILALCFRLVNLGAIIPSRRCSHGRVGRRVETLLQRLLVEQASSPSAKELERAADAAPDGQVLDRCERVALTSGAASSSAGPLADTLERRPPRARGKGGPHRPCPCGRRRRHKGRSPRSVVTAIGRISVRRAYLARAGCGSGGVRGRPADRPGGPEPPGPAGDLLGRRPVVVRRGGRLAAGDRRLDRQRRDDPPRLPGRVEGDGRLAGPTPARAGLRGLPLRRGVGRVPETDAAKVNTRAGWARRADR